MDKEELFRVYYNNKETVIWFLGIHYRLYKEGMTISEARDTIQKFDDAYKQIILKSLGPRNAHLYRKDMKFDEACALECLQQYTHLYVAGMTAAEACDAARREARYRERQEEHFAHDRQLQAALDAKYV